MKMVDSSLTGKKTLWAKEKLLVTSNLSFSHRVFKRLVPETRKNQGLFGKGLTRDDLTSIMHNEDALKPFFQSFALVLITYDQNSYFLPHSVITTICPTYLSFDLRKVYVCP